MCGKHLWGYLSIIKRSSLLWPVLWKLVVTLHNELHPLMERSWSWTVSWNFLGHHSSWYIKYNFCLHRVVPIGMWNLHVSTCIYIYIYISLFFLFTFPPILNVFLFPLDLHSNSNMTCSLILPFIVRFDLMFHHHLFWALALL